MFNSQYYTCEQIDQRLLQGYLDDYNSQNNTNLTKEQFLTLLFNTIGRNSTVDNLVTQIGYYECDTAAATAAKTVDASGFMLAPGGSIKVKMTNANSADNATLNINSTGAKALYYAGERASATNSWEAGETVEIYYDGTNYYANNVAGGSGSGDGAFDVSAKYPTSGVEGGNTYTLEGALAVLNANLHASKKKGGMSIKFIQSSDNKYVKFFCTADEFTTDVTKWQGVDDELTAGSDNLAKSGVVYEQNNQTCKMFGEAVFEDAKIDERTHSVSGTLTEISPSETKNGYYDIDSRLYISNNIYTQKIFDVVEGNVYVLKAPSQGVTNSATITLLYNDSVVFCERQNYNDLKIIAKGFNKIALQTDNCYVKQYENYRLNISEVDGAVITDGSVVEDKLSFVETGTNLYDKNKAVSGYLNSDGTITSSSLYETSDFIPVTAGKTYLFACDRLNVGKIQEGAGRAYLCYDSSKAPLTSDGAYLLDTNNRILGFTVIENTAFVRISIRKVDTDSMLFCDSEEMTFVYEAYKRYISDNNLPSEIDGSKIQELSVSLNKLSFVDKFTGKNLFNKNANLVIDNYYITESGLLSNNDSYFTSDFIEIDPTKYYTISNNGNSSSFRFALIYGENKLPLDNGYLENQRTIPPTTGAKYVRFSALLSNKDTIQFEEGNSMTSFESWYEYYKIKQSALPAEIINDGSITMKKLASTNPVVSALGVEKCSDNVELSAGDVVSLTDFPLFVKKDIKISFMADVTTMGTFYIGRGYQGRGGKYVKIDATNITPVSCDLSGNETVGDSIAHGLTISTFVKVILDVTRHSAGVYKCSVEIQSVGGKNIIELPSNWGNAANAVFVKSDAYNGLICENGFLSAVHNNFKKEIWFVGDSYLSLGDSKRWPYYIEELGYNNYLIEAVSGGAQGVYTDALKLLDLCSPKYLVWCLGMNFTSDTDSNTPNPTWKSDIDNIMSICNERGITLILSTTPCVPQKNNEGKNKYVRDSGYRYIDFARAVHGETYTAGVDNWYEGYLNHGTEQSPDNIHPTALGAQALATQCLVDFPELMEYSVYQKPVGGIPASDIASGVIPDVSNFITRSVNDLVNYYLKSETYTKTEVNNLIGAINQFHYEIYASTSDVSSPASNVLYLIGPASVSGGDKYEEYIWPDAITGFVKIGDTSIDLSGYVTTTALNTALADYTTTANLTTLLSDKADKVTNATNGNLAGLDANGNLTDSGIAANEVVGSTSVRTIVTLTQAQYDALATKDANTEYNIIESI